MSLQVLFTVLSVLAVAASAFFATLARESSAKAAHHEHRLAIMRGQVAGLEAAMMGLDAKHTKLAGRVYADEYWRGKRDEQPDLNLDATGQVPRAECENWKTAQREGPNSPAAKCECAICEAHRAERASRRAKLRSGVKS